METKLNNKIFEVAIIGGGAGGLFASTTADFFNFENVLIEQKPYLGGQPLELYPNKYIYDFPCFSEIKSNDVIKMLIEQQKKCSKNTTLLETQIIDITQCKIEHDIPGFEIKIKNNSNFYTMLAKNIIIATGNGSFNPKKLEINNKEILDNFIHYSVELSSDIYKNKKIVVLGGGDSAVDWSNYFVDEKITNDVTIIHRRDTYRCASKMIENLSKNKIIQKLNYEIIDIDLKEKELTIKHNISSDTEKIKYDFLIVQYGQKTEPFNIQLFDQINREKNKFLIDLNQKTNVPYIYAIGDATYFEYKANTIVTTCAEATRAIWHISKNKSRKW